MTVDLDERKIRRNETGMWLGWTLATMAGMLVGFVPFAPLVDILELWLFRILVPLWAGFLVGVFQWMVLRRYMTNAFDWILNGGAGWALGFALGLLIIQVLGDTFLGALIAYLLFGVIVGVIQWPALRREIPNALTWIIASVIGWALGAFLSQQVLNLIVTGDTTSQVLSTTVISGVTGLIAGAVTGAALVLITRQPEVWSEP